MCLIIDANCAADALSPTPHEDFKPLIDAIMQGKAKLTLGGTKLRTEYQRLSAAWRFIVALDRAGRTVMHKDEPIDILETELIAASLLKSDDPHVIALAKISNARLLCSKDQALHSDFTSARILSSPRGSVYQNKSHAKLLKKCC